MLSAICREIKVAREAATIFTILFPIRIAMIILSGLCFNSESALDQLFFAFLSALTLCGGSEVKAVSLPEKNIERKMRTMNQNNDKGSMMIRKSKITFHYRKSLFEIKIRMTDKFSPLETMTLSSNLLFFLKPLSNLWSKISLHLSLWL